MSWLNNPAFWASIGVVLDSIGIEAGPTLVGHIAVIVSAVCGVIGILEALWHAGHHLEYHNANVSSQTKQ